MGLVWNDEFKAMSKGADAKRSNLSEEENKFGSLSSHAPPLPHHRYKSEA